MTGGALITAAIDLARSSGLTAIAEGVETHEQLRELTVLDRDLAVGGSGREGEPPIVVDVLLRILR